jgi:hypothetical protein
MLSAGTRAEGVSTHMLPQRPSDVPDDRELRFVVLGPEAASEPGRPSTLARQFLESRLGPDHPRVA